MGNVPDPLLLHAFENFRLHAFGFQLGGALGDADFEFTARAQHILRLRRSDTISAIPDRAAALLHETRCALPRTPKMLPSRRHALADEDSVATQSVLGLGVEGNSASPYWKDLRKSAAPQRSDAG